MKRTGLRFLSGSYALVFALATFAPLAARAQQAPAAPPAQPQPKQDLGSSSGQSADRPWARSTTPEEQKLATEMFREGNALLKESLYVQAAAKYREALQHWNHPGIHYNLALALLNLDQPVEVIAQLEEATKYGAAPLDADKFEHASRYRALIEKQLARIVVTSNNAGAKVTMDGQLLFTAPGRWESLVRIGQHTFVAQKPGYVTTTKSPMLPPGEKTTIDLAVYTDDELTVYKRRWNNALPWTVFGAGLVLTGLGGILHWQASEKFKAYDKGIAECAAQGGGQCFPVPSSVASKKTTGDGMQIGAFSMYAVGGALVVVGSVLAYLNRARPTRINPDKETKVSVLPMLGPSGGGVITTFTF